MVIKKKFNGLEYKIETIEDYLTDMEIKYMTGNVNRRRNMDAIMYSEFSSDDLSYSKVNKKVEKLIRKNGGYTVIPKEVKKVKIIIKNNKTGKHYKIEMGGKVKVGDKIMRLNEHEYLYNGRFEYCEVVKVFETKKEVKKVRPYLEVKVVKEEKPKVTIANRNDKNWEYISDKDLVQLINTAHGQLRKREISRRGKGNWVNGENVDKIKFPCFCSFIWCRVKKYGMLYEMADEYILININSQYKYKLTSISNKSLKDLILTYDIHILKGKIVLYEEGK